MKEKKNNYIEKDVKAWLEDYTKFVLQKLDVGLWTLLKNQ